jgi:hypothetical protein
MPNVQLQNLHCRMSDVVKHVLTGQASRLKCVTRSTPMIMSKSRRSSTSYVKTTPMPFTNPTPEMAVLSAWQLLQLHWDL